MTAGSKWLAANDFFFTSSEVAGSFTLIMDGVMEYVPYRDGDDSDKIEVDCRTDWIAEPALWLVEWKYLGDLYALSSAELLILEPAKFTHEVGRSPIAYQLVSSYAQKYVAWMNRPDYLLSDIGSGETLQQDITDFLTEKAAGDIGTQFKRKFLSMVHIGGPLPQTPSMADHNGDGVAHEDSDSDDGIKK